MHYNQAMISASHTQPRRPTSTKKSATKAVTRSVRPSASTATLPVNLPAPVPFEMEIPPSYREEVSGPKTPPAPQTPPRSPQHHEFSDDARVPENNDLSLNSTSLIKVEEIRNEVQIAEGQLSPEYSNPEFSVGPIKVYK